MAKDQGIIAGQGWVFYAEPDTDAPTTLDTFNPVEKNIAGFTWLGSTSKENLTSFEKEGGEITVLDTWDTPAIRSIKADEKWSVTINSVSISQDTFKLAFPSGKWNAEKGGYDITAKAATTAKALLLVVQDPQNGFLGVYFPRGTLSLGEVPSFNAEGFMEVPLLLNALTSEKSGIVMRWLLPKSLRSGVTGAESTGR